jgi:hypothetical protein
MGDQVEQGSDLENAGMTEDGEFLSVCEPLTVVDECRALHGENIPDGGLPIEAVCENLELGCCDSSYYMSETVANCVLDNDDRFDKLGRVAFLKNDEHSAQPVWELWQEFGTVDFMGVALHAQTGATLWFEDIEGCTG